MTVSRLRSAWRCVFRRCVLLAPLAVFVAGFPAYGQDELRIVQKEGIVLVQSAGHTLLEYQAIPNPRKPYVKQLFSPGGVNVLRDSPFDHKHHHGAMFAVAVDGVDFWSENDKCGRVASRSVSGCTTGSRDGLSTAEFSQTVDWTDPGSEKILMKEQRTIAVHQVPGVRVTLMTWQCELAAPEGKESIALGGSTYFGLGMRFLVSMDSGGSFQNADGKTGVKDTNAARSAWCAYSALADGKPVTVAVFDDKANPRHPATWFSMEQFAYVSATLDLSKQPLKIASGKPLVLRYGVALWDGKAEKTTIDQVYQRWLALGVGKP